MQFKTLDAIQKYFVGGVMRTATVSYKSIKGDLNIWQWAMLLMVLVFSGCDSMHHAIYKYKGYNIILVSGPGAEDSVDSHCRKYVKKWDNGKPIDNQLIRACFLPHGSRKSNIVISEDHIDCLPHELCHADGQDEEYCGEKYPCVGEAL